MCATGIAAFDATRAAARVELVSPYTSTRSGRSASKTCSIPVSIRAVWVACGPLPTPRFTAGREMASSSKKVWDNSWS